MSPVSAFPTQPREGPPALTAEVQKQTLLDYLTAFGLASQLTVEEKLQFISVCQAYGLNPFKREVHIAVFGEGENRRLSIITGYEVYLKRAERTGKLDGWKAWGKGLLKVATIRFVMTRKAIEIDGPCSTRILAIGLMKSS
jgi:hypothetical protein